MKMKADTYEELKRDIVALVKKSGMDVEAEIKRVGAVRLGFDLLNVINTDRSCGDNSPTYKVRPRFLPYTGRRFLWLYEKGLTDNHIETAIKKILADCAVPKLFETCNGGVK